MNTTTTTESTMLSFAAAHGAALGDALAADDSVFLLGEDIADREGGGVYRVTQGLSTKYGVARVRSTPISEQAIVGAAIGAALTGMRPVAEIMLMNFLAVSMDQITNHAAKIRFMSGGQTGVPLTIRTSTGAGASFGAQHSDMLEAWFAHTAGLKVVTASSPAEGYGLLSSCIFDDDPCIYIENTLMNFSAPEGDPVVRGTRIPLGQANVLREGSDVTLISYGKPIMDLLPLVDQLASEGVGAELIDLRTIAPWDERTVLDSVAKTHRAVVVHEAVLPFGVGAEISSRIHEELFGELEAPVRRIGSRFTPVPFASPLEYAYLQSADDVERAVRATLS